MRIALKCFYFIEDFINSKTILIFFMGSWVPQRISSHHDRTKSHQRRTSTCGWKQTAAALFTIVLLSALAASCGKTIGPADVEAPAEAFDAVTAATPGLLIRPMREDHREWLEQTANCLACHEDVHRAGYRAPVCVTCHGRAGIPQRSLWHSISECTPCHPVVHQGLDFQSPGDCTLCHKFVPSASCPAVEETDVVVIGAGGGGLAAAAALAKAGHEVVLLEKHHQVGGYMSRFQRGDYRFEVSLHAMDGMNEALDGINVGAFKCLDVWDRITPVLPGHTMRLHFPGRTLDIPADAGEHRALLKEMYPDDAGDIDRLFDDLAEVDRVFKALIGIQHEGLSWQPILTLISRPLVLMRVLTYLNMTVSEFIEDYTQNPELIAIWTYLTPFAGAEPDRLAAMFYIVIWNSYHFGGWTYFEGGSQAVSESLADVVEESGGKIRLGTLATKIDIEDGRAVQVHTEDDVCYRSCYVVANNNAPDLFLGMIGEEYLPTDYVDQLKNTEIGMSCFQVYLGVDKDFSDYFNGIHEFSIMTSWDQSENFRYISEGDPERAGLAAVNYSMVDPTAAPEGKKVIVLTSVLPYDWEEAPGWNLDLGYESYRDLKEYLAAVFIRRAEEYLPGLSDHIEVMEVGTPRTMQGFTLNPKGTIFGWDNTPEQSLFERLPQRTPIRNLFLAGAWTFPGGGQSAVIQSGIAAADIIEKEMSR